MITTRPLFKACLRGHFRRFQDDNCPECEQSATITVRRQYEDGCDENGQRILGARKGWLPVTFIEGIHASGVREFRRIR